MDYRVGAKGQVVIAKELRDRLGIGPGWIALQRLAGDRVELRFLPPQHSDSLKGSLAPHLRRDGAPEDWDRAREHAWREAAAARERGVRGAR